MRLHELEVTAFGPFADTVRVDFDDLSEAGLFLLSGATGAGKTSVLDAVCFALYGEVPGERNAARRLRCDRAAPDVAPQVRLVATLAGRRLELSRSPAWQRPKKRGTGLTTEQAGVRVRELRDGAWTTHTTRLDEAGHLVTTLLGMNLAQFTQVAMLPQGRFQAFLAADSDERQRLLQRLFGTARFERVEGWLRERRTELRRSHESAHRGLADAVSRVSEVAGCALPGWDVDDLALPARAGDLDRWSAELAATAAESQRGLVAEGARAQRTERRAREAVDQARAVHERHRRRAEAQAEQAALDDRAAEHRAEVDRHERALRALAVAPVRQVADGASRQVAVAEREQDDALGSARPVFPEISDPGPTAAGWTALAEREVDAAADVRSLRPSAARAQEARREHARHTARADALHGERDHLDARQREAPQRIARLREQAAAAEHARAELEHRRQVLVGLRRRHRARVESIELREALVGARERHRHAREETLTRREELLEVRERRLAGMAAEIAGDLAVGAACPVCGSAEHPHRARPAPGSPDAVAERTAQSALDDANAVQHLRDQEVRDLETRAGAADALAGDDPDSLDDQLVQAGERVTSLEQLALDADALGEALQAAERAHARDATALAEVVAALAGAEAAAAAADAELRELDEQLAAALGEHADLEAVERHHLERAGAARRAARARDALAAAREQADAADAAALAAAREAGFDDVDDAREAHLPATALDDLERSVRAHRERLAAVRALLREDPDEVATPDDALPGFEPVLPDLDAVVGAHRAALAALHRHHADVAAARRRSARLGELDEETRQAVTRWRPVADELDLVGRLSAFVDGRSGDNRLQMRLSAYVLAFRLSQVVAAANVRLAGMSDQRYALEHTAERGRDRRGGLNLLIRDEWSGESRAPATLSGGETFVVSLALALGLSDVITAEAGGVELDTLFVDEGFGSLDADTLDDVMDTLDALRDGGRVVGVVSHVAEMRDRIPTQLVVTKQRSGSRVAVHR